MAKTKKSTNPDLDEVALGPTSAQPKFHKCRCICLENSPNYPYRTGYHRSYVDANNKTRCVYCSCLTTDPRVIIGDSHKQYSRFMPKVPR